MDEESKVGEDKRRQNKLCEIRPVKDEAMARPIMLTSLSHHQQTSALSTDVCPHSYDLSDLGSPPWLPETKPTPATSHSTKDNQINLMPFYFFFSWSFLSVKTAAHPFNRTEHDLHFQMSSAGILSFLRLNSRRVGNIHPLHVSMFTGSNQNISKPQMLHD